MSGAPHLAPTRRRWLWLAATAAAAALGATRLGPAPAAPGAERENSLAALPRRPNRAAAYLVARAADCPANFDLLDLFARSPVRDRLALVGVLALGDSAGAAAVQHALASRGYDLPVWPATARARATLASLGHRSTPFLVVLAADGSLRFVAPAPGSVRDYLALGDALPHVGDSNTLPERH